MLFGVGKASGGPLRPRAACVGVLALVVGVLARDVGVVALDALPFARGCFNVDGEFDRVDSGLAEPVGLLSFLTDRGSLEDVGAWLWVDGEFRVAPLRVMGGDGFCVATSLRDRACPEMAVDDWGCELFSPVFALRYQELGDDGSTSGSDKLR